MCPRRGMGPSPTWATGLQEVQASTGCVSSPQRRSDRRPAGSDGEHGLPFPSEDWRAHSCSACLDTVTSGLVQGGGLTEQAPAPHVVRVRPAASGATERDTPFPGQESRSRHPPPGEAPRVEPSLCLLPLWGDCREAASPTQTPAVGGPRPQPPPKENEEDTRLPALMDRIP